MCYGAHTEFIRSSYGVTPLLVRSCIGLASALLLVKNCVKKKKKLRLKVEKTVSKSGKKTVSKSGKTVKKSPYLK